MFSALTLYVIQRLCHLDGQWFYRKMDLLGNDVFSTFYSTSFTTYHSHCRLPPAFFINRMKELYTLMIKQETQGRVKLLCDSCNNTSSPAKAICRDCAHYLCRQCEEAHIRMKMFSEHVVVPLNHLRRDTVAHAPTTKAVQPFSVKSNGMLWPAQQVI